MTTNGPNLIVVRTERFRGPLVSFVLTKDFLSNKLRVNHMRKDRSVFHQYAFPMRKGKRNFSRVTKDDLGVGGTISSTLARCKNNAREK